jgi:hypothetical protein
MGKQDDTVKDVLEDRQSWNIQVATFLRLHDGTKDTIRMNRVRCSGLR